MTSSSKFKRGSRPFRIPLVQVTPHQAVPNRGDKVYVFNVQGCFER